MRNALLSAVLAAPLFLAAQSDVIRLHEADTRMGWDQAVEYCRNLDAHVPDLKTMKDTYYRGYRGRQGERPYQMDTYWSLDQFDIDGAYAFDFSSGLHRVEWKGNRYRVMCIQIDSANYSYN